MSAISSLDNKLEVLALSEWQSQLKPSIFDYSISEIKTLKESLKQLKAQEGKEGENYRRFKTEVDKICEANFPFRSYMMWKREGVNCFRGINRFFPYNASIKENRVKIKQQLLEISANPQVETKLKLLSKLTFLHGSNSATLAMMSLLKEWRLQCRGDLLAQEIIPMNGELSPPAITPSINVHNLSGETVRDLERVISYAKIYPFRPDELFNSLLNPVQLHERSAPETLWKTYTIRFQQLKQWDFPTFCKRMEPIRQDWLYALEKEKLYREQPLLSLLELIDHAITEEEILFYKEFQQVASNPDFWQDDQIQQKMLASMPEFFRSFFGTLKDIPLEISYFPFSIRGAQSTLYYCRGGHRDWHDEFINPIFLSKLQIEPKDLLEKEKKFWSEFSSQEFLVELKDLFQAQLQLIESNYQAIRYEIESLEPPKYAIPDHLRDLITEPFPLIFSSTAIKPKPSNQCIISPPEYLMDHPIPIGPNGCNVLFTDTEESIAKIQALFPNLDVEVRLISEITFDLFPLCTAPFQLD